MSFQLRIAIDSITVNVSQVTSYSYTAQKSLYAYLLAIPYCRSIIIGPQSKLDAIFFLQ